MNVILLTIQCFIYYFINKILNFIISIF